MNESELKFRQLLGQGSKGGSFTVFHKDMPGFWMTLHPEGLMTFGVNFNLDTMSIVFWEAIKNTYWKTFNDLDIYTGSSADLPKPAIITITNNKKCKFKNFTPTQHIKNIWETIAATRPEETISNINST